MAFARRRLALGDRDPAHRRDRGRRGRVRARRHRDRRRLHAAVTLAVAYPHMCGVGGDLFALVQRADGETTRDLLERALPDGRRPRRARTADGRCRSAARCRSRCPARWRAGTRCTRPARVSPGPRHSRTPIVAGRRRGRRSADRSPASLRDPEAPFADDAGLAAIFYPGGEAAALGTTVAQPALATHPARRSPTTAPRRSTAATSAGLRGRAGRRRVADHHRGPRRARGRRARADARGVPRPARERRAAELPGVRAAADPGAPGAAWRSIPTSTAPTPAGSRG